MSDPSTDTEVTAAELRAEIRGWRRGRADKPFWDAFSDAYVAIFSTLLIGAMAVSALDTVRDLTNNACQGSCGPVRGSVPVLAVLAVAGVSVGMARLLGPVFVAPAADHWMLSSPVSRSALLRPALLRAILVGLLSGAVLMVGPTLVGAARATDAVAVGVAGTLAAAAAATWSAVDQITGRRRLRFAGPILMIALWAGLCLAAVRPEYLPTHSTEAKIWWPVAAGLGVLFTAGLWLALRRLDSAARARLAPTQQAWPSLSGALASFDLTLLFDVLQSRRWAAVAHVRSRRGGPLGWWALVYNELRRVRRNPRPWVALLAAAVTPFALIAAGTERAAAIGTAVVGFLVGPSLASGFRVVVRTPTLARIYPFTAAQVRRAHLILPGAGLLLLGLVGGISLTSDRITDLTTQHALLLGLVSGWSSLAATVRWLGAAPPNYSAPLLSTPAGGLPSGMMLGFVKGFDVLLLTALPLLLGPGWWIFSATVSFGVVAYYLNEHPLTK